MVNICEGSVSTRYEYMKRNTKCGKWGGLGSYRSLKVTGYCDIQYSTYKFLLDLHSNYVSMLQHFAQFLRYSKILV